MWHYLIGYPRMGCMPKPITRSCNSWVDDTVDIYIKSSLRHCHGDGVLGHVHSIFIASSKTTPHQITLQPRGGTTFSLDKGRGGGGGGGGGAMHCSHNTAAPLTSLSVKTTHPSTSDQTFPTRGPLHKTFTGEKTWVKYENSGKHNFNIWLYHRKKTQARIPRVFLR